MISSEGGFRQDFAMKRSLLEYQNQLSHADGNDPWLKRFPIFIVIRNRDTVPIAEDAMSRFSSFVPDFSGYYATSEKDDDLKYVGFDRQQPHDGGQNPVFNPVVLFKIGDTFAVCSKASSEMVAIPFESQKNNFPVDVFDPSSGTFKNVGSVQPLSANSRYSRGVFAWLKYLSLVQNPSKIAVLLPEIVRLSRGSGILVPSTSYLVVENPAQWKALELKEKQKLANREALEFTDSPEPSTWILLGGITLFILLRCASKRAAFLGRFSES